MNRYFSMLALGLVMAIGFTGCADKPVAPTEFKSKPKDEHDHTDHDRGTTMLEDATLPGGKKCHAGLTAHISKEHGNELDVSFETFDKEPKPVTLPENVKLTARVTRDGDEMAYELIFAPTEKDERKTDKDGECSRFAAKAPWMKLDDKITVTLSIEGAPQPTVWVDFNPKKYSHTHADE